MNKNLQDQVPLNKPTEEGLVRAILDLVSKIDIVVNSFQMQRVCDELMASADHIFVSANSQQPARLSSRQRGSPETLDSAPHNSASDSSQPDIPPISIKQSLIAEYREKLGKIEPSKIKKLDIKDLEKFDDDATQIQELVKSHQRVQQSLKELDLRLLSLERLTANLAELMADILESDY